MTSKTVRELGGEIWAELSYEMENKRSQGDTTFAGYDFKALNPTVDIIMSVLARYIGQVIVNDEDFPVEPLTETED